MKKTEGRIPTDMPPYNMDGWMMHDTSLEQRENLWNAGLDTMGFDFMPSYTSFILFPIEMEGRPFLEKMYETGVGVRAFEVFGKSYCRVGMGKKEEMVLFLDSLKKVLV